MTSGSLTHTCPPARLLPTYLWSRSKARKLTSSSSSRKARPAMEKTARIVNPSAPSPRTLSRSWAGLGPQEDTYVPTGLPDPSPAPRPLRGKGIGEARVWGLGKQTWVMKGSGGYQRGLCGRSMEGGGKHSRVSLGSGGLESWGISPSPYTHSPKPPHLLPFWSAILGLSSWGIVTSC